jgi:hypothetical protein
MVKNTRGVVTSQYPKTSKPNYGAGEAYRDQPSVNVGG